MKNAMTTIVIAAVVAMFSPRNQGEAAAFAIRAGSVLVYLGLWLDPPGYDAGRDEEPDESDIDIQRVARTW